MTEDPTGSAGAGGGEVASLLRDVVARLARAGCVAAEDEASELIAAAGADRTVLERLVARRAEGEPLAWITTWSRFGQFEVHVDTGVYVPRWQSVELARRAVSRLPHDGLAVDVCTGSGALALALRRSRPTAHIVATDVDARAVACARANGVAAYRGDLFEAVPSEFRGRTDVVVAVAPYVPTSALEVLPRDTLHFEDVTLYDGGSDGTCVIRRILADAPDFLRPGGALLLEVGGTQHRLLAPELERLGYTGVETWADDDGDLRGIQAVR